MITYLKDGRATMLTQAEYKEGLEKHLKVTHQERIAAADEAVALLRCPKLGARARVCLRPWHMQRRLRRPRRG